MFRAKLPAITGGPDFGRGLFFVVLAPFQRWLTEFRNNPDDNFMVALFADHWLR